MCVVEKGHQSGAPGGSIRMRPNGPRLDATACSRENARCDQFTCRKGVRAATATATTTVTAMLGWICIRRAAIYPDTTCMTNTCRKSCGSRDIVEKLQAEKVYGEAMVRHGMKPTSGQLVCVCGLFLSFLFSTFLFIASFPYCVDSLANQIGKAGPSVYPGLVIVLVSFRIDPSEIGEKEEERKERKNIEITMEGNNGG